MKFAWFLLFPIALCDLANALDGELGRASSGSSRITVTIRDRAELTTPRIIGLSWQICARVNPGLSLEVKDGAGNTVPVISEKQSEFCGGKSAPILLRRQKQKTIDSNNVFILTPNEA